MRTAVEVAFDRWRFSPDMDRTYRKGRFIAFLRGWQDHDSGRELEACPYVGARPGNASGIFGPRAAQKSWALSWKAGWRAAEERKRT